MAPRKAIPTAALLWRDDRIRALLDGLIGGDGHTRLDDGRELFVQKNDRDAGVAQALALRLGLSAVHSRRSDGVSIVYLTEHQTRSFRGTNGYGAPIGRQKYAGIVWCPKLPLGTWIARRQGRAFITGNTFPPALIEPCILAGCPTGGVVLDPFAGSGTTLMVADKLGRDAIGIELNPDYVAMCERRAREPGFRFLAAAD